MRWLLTTGLLLSAMTALAQTPPPTVPVTPPQLPDSASTELPDAPIPAQAQQQDVVAVAEASFKVTGDGAHSCGFFSAMKVVYFDPSRYDQVPKPCTELFYPYQRFLTTNVVIPMTWQQKGYLALHDLTDPANFGTILGISAITIGANAHTAYGPGLKGFGKSVGVSLLQDATGQFFGAFAIPAVVHQDPRYFRMPHAPFKKRLIYSISRTVISRSDSGKSMPNYATLLNYPIGAELANFYVPGIHPDGASTVARIFTGYALDPVNNLVNEFLPDVASHVHIQIIFVQRIINNVAAGNAVPGT
ncbi:MAG TPA: hypothetical protein VK813_08170 [Edaphobacter sp.]|jgi:hypothetical protein|nr:hypothetical protein [Edaphobacter sp.]